MKPYEKNMKRRLIQFSLELENETFEVCTIKMRKKRSLRDESINWDILWRETQSVRETTNECGQVNFELKSDLIPFEYKCNDASKKAWHR